jgi:hypothetical protein
MLCLMGCHPVNGCEQVGEASDASLVRRLGPRAGAARRRSRTGTARREIGCICGSSDRPEGARGRPQSLIPPDRAGGSCVKLRGVFGKLRRERFVANIDRRRGADPFVPRTKQPQPPTEPVSAGSTIGRCDSSEFSLSSELVIILPGQLLGNVGVHHLLDPIFSRSAWGHQCPHDLGSSDIGFVAAISQEILQIGLVRISPICV